jgi:tRNA acetyltransferase TAN1
VAFDGRAHSGECKDRMAVINAVVEHIPQPPHKVDLTNPDKTILVQVLKVRMKSLDHQWLLRFDFS